MRNLRSTAGSLGSTSAQSGSRIVSSIHLGSIRRSRNLIRACAVRATGFFIGAVSRRRRWKSASPIHLQRRDKSLLRDGDLTELPQLLLACLRLLCKFAFPG